MARDGGLDQPDSVSKADESTLAAKYLDFIDIAKSMRTKSFNEQEMSDFLALVSERRRSGTWISKAVKERLDYQTEHPCVLKSKTDVLVEDEIFELPSVHFQL